MAGFLSWQALRRANSDTPLFPESMVARVIEVLATAASGAFGWRMPKTPTTGEQIRGAVLGAAVGLLVLFCLRFLFNWFRAPSLIQEEKEAQRDQTIKRLEDKIGALSPSSPPQGPPPEELARRRLGRTLSGLQAKLRAIQYHLGHHNGSDRDQHRWWEAQSVELRTAVARIASEIPSDAAIRLENPDRKSERDKHPYSDWPVGVEYDRLCKLEMGIQEAVEIIKGYLGSPGSG